MKLYLRTPEHRRTSKIFLALIAAIASTAILTACTADNTARSGTDIANDRTNYSPTHDVEGHNYNARQELADNPATLLWCTVFPPTPGSHAFTVPIVGKLTSGNKRPYPVEQAFAGAVDAQKYNPEVAAPDGMYGTSGEYRYGFDPAGNYNDIYNLATFCTTVPNVYQREETVLVIKDGADPVALQGKIEAALKDCRDKDPDPSKPCPAATALLGD